MMKIDRHQIYVLALLLFASMLAPKAAMSWIPLIAIIISSFGIIALMLKIKKLLISFWQDQK